ncbi:MAG: GIY-YIG nuclease family protein [Mycoplasmatales bacterium]
MKTESFNVLVKYDEDNNFCKKIYKKHENLTAFSFTREAHYFFKDDKTSQNQGIYFIFSIEKNKIYIGKSSNGITRIFDHNKSKDFWTRGMLFTSISFNATEITWLESEFISYFDNENIEVENKKNEQQPSLDEMDLIPLKK